MLLLIGFAFLSGLVTILAPCIWPLLPIVLSTSIVGKKLTHHRPLGVVIGILISFGIFTLIISSIFRAFHLDPNILRTVAVIVIALLGIAMLAPGFGALLELFVSRVSGKLAGTKREGEFIPGLLTGMTLGIVWSPCAGPILASIAALAATGKVTGTVALVLAAYLFGVGIPLFIFAYASQQLLSKTRFLSKYLGRIQQVFGVVMIFMAFLIYKGYDTKLLTLLPDFSQSLNGFEKSSTVSNQLNALKGQMPSTETQTVNGLFNENKPAPDFLGVTKWLNTDKPLTIAALKGKVVLIDFWTYTCINCIRTLPHVTSWYDKYKDDGFVVIGVHTPEFEFEKNTGNVQDAIKRFNIHYAVPQDNNYGTWNAYTNQYWPAEYLIDATGTIRRTHFGEGEYDETEKAIQALLKEAGMSVTGKTVDMPDETPSQQVTSQETYLGSERMQFYYPSGSVGDGTKTFTADALPAKDTFSFDGEWTIDPKNATAGKNGTIIYNFNAQKVFLVMRPPVPGRGRVKVLLDGKPIDPSVAGTDVHDGTVTVDSDRLYDLVKLKDIENHILRLEFEAPGTQAFAFTFG